MLGGSRGCESKEGSPGLGNCTFLTPRTAQAAVHENSTGRSTSCSSPAAQTECTPAVSNYSTLRTTPLSAVKSQQHDRPGCPFQDAQRHLKSISVKALAAAAAMAQRSVIQRSPVVGVD